MNEPKDLRYFKNKVAIREGYLSWHQMKPYIKPQKAILYLHDAAEQFASYEFGRGYNMAQSEAIKEISKNYQPNH